MPYFPAGAADLIDPYAGPSGPTPVTAVEVTANGFKKAVRTMMATDQTGIQVVVVTMNSSGRVEIVGIMPTVADGRTLFDSTLRSPPSGARYVGLFERQGSTWAELITRPVATHALNWRTAALAALAGVGVLWWITKGRKR